MKLFHPFTNAVPIVVLAGMLCAADNSALADEATNAAAPATNHLGFSFKIDAGHKTAGAQDYFGLPKEAFDRLTPEQIMELAKSHQHTAGAEMVPEMMVTVLVPIGMFGMICVCVWLGVSQRLKRQRILHDTVQKMIEKGQSIPPELLQPTDMARRPRSDLRTGLVLVSIGIGAMLFLVGVGGAPANAWGLGLIPLLMGFAFLITWKIESGKNGQPK